MPDPEGNPETTDNASNASADLDAATAWARAHLHDGPHVVSAPIVTMQAPLKFDPGHDGRDERRVHLPEQAIVRMPAGAPLLRLTWKVQFNGAGPAEYAGTGCGYTRASPVKAKRPCAKRCASEPKSSAARRRGSSTGPLRTTACLKRSGKRTGRPTGVARATESWKPSRSDGARPFRLPSGGAHSRPRRRLTYTRSALREHFA